MNEKTLVALQGSIKKWEDITAGTGADRGSKNCPLCALFYDNNCDGCIVAESTGHTECQDTPYVSWLRNQTYTQSCRVEETIYNGFKVYDAISKSIAQDEVDFLKSLLPKEQS